MRVISLTRRLIINRLTIRSFQAWLFRPKCDLDINISFFEAWKNCSSDLDKVFAKFRSVEMNINCDRSSPFQSFMAKVFSIRHLCLRAAWSCKQFQVKQSLVSLNRWRNAQLNQAFKLIWTEFYGKLYRIQF